MSGKPLKGACGAQMGDKKIFCDKLPGHEGEHKGSVVVTFEWVQEK